jgi:cytidylate kinase
MGTVTIAATYGTGGSVIAPAIAEQLGLHLIDRAIPVALAAKMARPLHDALADDEHRVSQLASILTSCINMSGLFVGVPVAPEALGHDERIAATERALVEAADAGGAVILGRAGVFVLKDRKDTLHVRLTGPREARVKQAMAHEGIDEASALSQLKETDAARQAYIRYFYSNENWEDPSHYHLVIDSTAIPLDACTDMIVAAARARFATPSTISATLPSIRLRFPAEEVGSRLDVALQRCCRCWAGEPSSTSSRPETRPKGILGLTGSAKGDRAGTIESG